MELLNEIRFYKKTGKNLNNILREAIFQQELFEGLVKEGEVKNSSERIDILNKINNDIYIRNDYKSFASELPKNKRSTFLTLYTAEALKDENVQTFQVEGYEIGFGLKPDENGDMSIVGVHNNTYFKDIGSALIDSAIRMGGRTLDHFDGFLSGFYGKKGFDEVDRIKWDDKYAPEGWEEDLYGKPDVVFRKLK